MFQMNKTWEGRQGSSSTIMERKNIAPMPPPKTILRCAVVLRFVAHSVAKRLAKKDRQKDIQSY